MTDAASLDVDLVLFEAGGRHFAADAWDVVRVDRRQGDAPTAFVAPATGYRVLVVQGPSGEVQVPIDRLLGFQRVDAAALHALPTYACGLASAAVVGAWLAQQEMVLLIDLLALVRELDR